MLGLRLHDHTRAATTRARRAGQQPVGEHLRRERGFVDARRGRIELDRLDQLVGRDGARPARAPPRRARAGAPARPADRTGRAPTASGSAANAPSVRSPSRARRSTSSLPPPYAASTEPASTVTGHGARNAGDSPGGTTTTSSRVLGARAASPAANVAVGDPDAHVDDAELAHARRRPAPPARRHHRSSATVRASGTTAGPVVRARAAARAPRPRAPRARTRARRRRRRRRAPRAPRSAPRLHARRSPTATPSARASADADAHHLPALVRARRPRPARRRSAGSRRRAATTGQSGHHSAQVRCGVDRTGGHPARASSPTRGRAAAPAALHLHLEPSGRARKPGVGSRPSHTLPRPRAARTRRPPATPRRAARRPRAPTRARGRAPPAGGRRRSAHPARHLGQHQAHAVEQGRDHGGPAGGGNPPDHREPFERHPGLGRGERPEGAVEVDRGRPLPQRGDRGRELEGHRGGRPRPDVARDPQHRAAHDARRRGRARPARPASGTARSRASTDGLRTPAPPRRGARGPRSSRRGSAARAMDRRRYRTYVRSSTPARTLSAKRTLRSRDDAGGGQAVGSGVGSGSTPMARSESGDQPASSP